MDGQQLHRVRIRFTGHDRQPALLLGGCLQPGQESRKVDACRGAGVVLGNVREGVKVAPGLVDADPGLRGYLDVQPDGPFGLAQQRLEVVVDESAQVTQLVTQRAQPGQCLGTQGATVAGDPVRVRQVVKGLDQARGVVQFRPGLPAGDFLGALGCIEVFRPAVLEREFAAPRQESRPVGKGHQVGRTDAPARPGQQPHQVVRTVGVNQHVERRDDVGDLGHAQQPAEAQDLVRDPGVLQPAGDGGQLRAGAAEHRHGRVAPVLGEEGIAFGDEAPGQCRRLLGPGGVAGQFHLSCSGKGAGFQRRHRNSGGCYRVQLRGNGVGRL